MLSRQVRKIDPSEACPSLVDGAPAPDRFFIRENGLQFELSFREGSSVGLFLDQRDNRRRLLTRHIAAGFSLLLERSPESELKSPSRGPRASIAQQTASHDLGKPQERAR